MSEKFFDDIKILSISKQSGDEKYIERLLDDLIGILDNELEQYRILTYNLMDQRKSFANGDIASFEEINKKQGTLVLKIKTLEEARKSVISQLANLLNIEKEEVTLSKLIELINEPYSERLSSFGDEIINIIKDLENVRESNSYLIQHALHYVSGVLRIFLSSNSDNTKYLNNGQIEQSQKKGKFVSSWG